MQVNLIARVDSYKPSHDFQLRPGTKKLSSYIEARKHEEGKNWNVVVTAGIQYHLLEYFKKPFVTKESLERMKKRMALHGPKFNADRYQYILDKHNGYLPLTIQALPEGLVVPLGTPIVQVTNNDPNCAPLVSYIETSLLRAIW